MNFKEYLTEIKTNAKGANIIFENDKVVVMKITDFEASLKYGQPQRDETGKNLFKMYVESGKNNMYFILPKNEQGDITRKTRILVAVDNDTKEINYIEDSQLQTQKKEWLNDIFKKYNILPEIAERIK